MKNVFSSCGFSVEVPHGHTIEAYGVVLTLKSGYRARINVNPEAIVTVYHGEWERM
jgi:hypothetical protein